MPLAVALAVVLCGCPTYGVVDDGTSVSFGPAHRGFLLEPNELPLEGEGFNIPPRWRRRGLRYGTDEMIALIVHLGRQISTALPGTVLDIADISRARGGPSRWHHSHQSGRDVDILFLVRDEHGAPVRLDDMEHFRADGSVTLASPGKRDREVFFDVERNWTLVRVLLDNPIAEIQQIFIYQPLAELLLDHARSLGESAAVIAQASVLLRQPSDSAPHDDHMHVRIYCPASDHSMGCEDRGALRWTKKDYKYVGDWVASNILIPAALGGSWPAMMALGTIRPWP